MDKNFMQLNMTDYFASQALVGLVNHDPAQDRGVAERCYMIADAMMRERQSRAKDCEQERPPEIKPSCRMCKYFMTSIGDIDTGYCVVRGQYKTQWLKKPSETTCPHHHNPAEEL